MNTKAKQTEVPEPPRALVTYRIKPALDARIKYVAAHLGDARPGSRSTEATVAESILEGSTTLEELEAEIARHARKVGRV